MLTTLAGAAATAEFDADKATADYLAALPAAAMERSARYFEGGYWLLLADLAMALAIAFILLKSGAASGTRDWLKARLRWSPLVVVAFIPLYVLASSVLELPLAIYETFVREHRFGLSNLTLTAWLGEYATGVLVNAVLLTVLLGLIYAVINAAPRTWHLWGTVVGTSVAVIALLLAPLFISPLFNDYTPMADGPLKHDILAMAHANGVPADNVYVFDLSRQSDSISANVTGIGATMRISLADNLLNKTDPDEVLAVTAHEMGHYVLGHVYELIAFAAALFFSGLVFLRGTFGFANAAFGARWGVTGLGDIAGLPLLIALVSIFLFLAQPFMNTIIRANEVEADIFGLNAARAPDGFATAALRLGAYRKLDPGPWEEFVMFDHPSGRSRVSMSMHWKAGQLDLGAPDQTPDLRLDRARTIGENIAKTGARTGAE